MPANVYTGKPEPSLVGALGGWTSGSVVYMCLVSVLGMSKILQIIAVCSWLWPGLAWSGSCGYWGLKQWMEHLSLFPVTVFFMDLLSWYCSRMMVFGIKGLKRLLQQGNIAWDISILNDYLLLIQNSNLNGCCISSAVFPVTSPISCSGYRKRLCSSCLKVLAFCNTLWCCFKKSKVEFRNEKCDKYR